MCIIALFDIAGQPQPSVVHFDDLSTFKNNKIAMAGEYDISYAGNPDFTIKNLFLKK